MKRGGVESGRGTLGIAYRKPEPRLEAALPEGCLWKDGYIMKVFNKGERKSGKEEWEKTKILREKKPEGVIYPESECTLIGNYKGRYALFSPYGGKSIYELFYVLPPNLEGREGDELTDAIEDAYEADWDRYEAEQPVDRNKHLLPDVLAALEVLKGHVRKMNEMGIFHGDLADGNVVYDETTKTAKLIDFGYMSVESEGSEEGSIDEIVRKLKKLEPKGGSKKSRRRAASSKRRTRRRLSSRSR